MWVGWQTNLVKQLAKLVKVRYVEDITHSERVGAALDMCSNSEMPQGSCYCRLAG